MNDIRQFMNVLTEEQHIEEAPLGKAKDAVLGKLGNKKAQANNEVRPAAEEMYKKWQQANKEAGNQLNTVPAMVKWLENNGIESDIVKSGFQGVGVQDISAFAKEEEKTGIMKWLDDEMIQPGALTGQVAKQYLVSQGVPEEKADTMLGRIGVKADGGKIVSGDQREKLDIIVQKFGTGDEEVAGDDETPVATDSETPTADWPASRVHEYILNKYEIDPDDLGGAFKEVGTDATSEDPIGDEALVKLTDAIAGGNVPERDSDTGDEIVDPDAAMEKTQEIAKKSGKTINKAIQQGKEAVKSGDVSDRSELQKLGMAILTARKKI